MLVTQPRPVILDEPTEGIQSSVVKEIARVIHDLARRGDMGNREIVIVKQYCDFARALAHLLSS